VSRAKRQRRATSCLASAKDDMQCTCSVPASGHDGRVRRTVHGGESLQQLWRDMGRPLDLDLVVDLDLDLDVDLDLDLVLDLVLDLSLDDFADTRALSDTWLVVSSNEKQASSSDVSRPYSPVSVCDMPSALLQVCVDEFSSSEKYSGSLIKPTHQRPLP
jgi:hypothetical protein